MKYTILGPSKEKIPVVGLGLGKGRGYEAKTASYGLDDERLIRLGLDLGMTFIDVAGDYGAGQAEETVGRALGGIREKAFIATKFPPEKSSYEGVITSAEESLGRLKTDRIDLFQTHWPNPQIPMEETLQGMEKLVRDGKVRYIGLSNCTLGEAKKAGSSSISIPVVSIQHEYNLLDRTAESQMIPFCAEHRMTFIGYSPLAHGRSGKRDNRFNTLEAMAKKYACSVTRLTLSWLTRHEGSMVVMRTSNEKHLMENAETGDLEVSHEDLEAISSIFASTVKDIAASCMFIKPDQSQKVYTTEEEARENRYGLSPSPTELATQIRAGEILKPIKLCIDPNEKGSQRYEVVEGKIRYWAWVIACGGNVLIPSVKQQPEECVR